MFNGIRPMQTVGRWHCYDVGIHALYAFVEGKLVMIIHQHKPNPAGGWYRTELTRQE